MAEPGAATPVVWPVPASLRRARWAVGAGYAAQGFGYATVVTALPALKERQHIDDTTVSLTVLLVCVCAAAGSVLAGAVAGSRGSRAAMVLGFVVQAAAFPVVVVSPDLALFLLGFALYGVGLGMVDAAAGMQAVIVQQRYGTTIMSGFFAWYTAAAIAGALLMSALARSGSAVVVALLVAAVVLAVVGVLGRSRFYADEVRVADVTLGSAPPGDAHEPAAVRPLPRAGIWLFGSVVLAAFVADSAVSTWSTIYLIDTLVTSATVAPLGYAAYQAAILASRLVGDAVVRRIGRAPVVAVTAAVSALGFLAVALVQTPAAAVLGFAVVGIGVGALVPLSFSAAGELDPGRSDDVIARLNLFNYVGAVLGAVAVGLLSDGPGLAAGFLIPMVLLLPTIAIARRFGGRTRTVVAPAVG
ncbi:MFS transporter [Cellulomonas hominis]